MALSGKARRALVTALASGDSGREVAQAIDAFVTGQATTGSASDTIATGLTTVTGVVATWDTDAADANFIVTASVGNQAGTPAAGSFLLKSWKTDGTDPTPVAATSFSMKVNWIAFGTK